MKNKQNRRKFILTSSKITASIFGAAVLGRFFSFSQSASQKKNIFKSKNL